MKPHRKLFFVPLVFSLLLFGGAVALLVNSLIGRTIAQSNSERAVEDNVPKHVPIKFKLKREKEKAFKDLNNVDWHRDFELEVKNTSDKPIYFLELWLVLPETKSENNVQLAFSLRYGRVDFIHFNTRPIPTDVPIQPGETHTFTIPETWQRGWREFKLRSNTPDPEKTKIKFVHLSFGDGTGFSGGGAEPYPYKRKQSSTGPCREGPKQSGDNAFRKSARIPFPELREHSLLPTPAAILPVSFFLVQTSYRQPEAPALPDINCPGTDCVFAKADTYSCFCSSEAITYQPVGSGDPQGACKLTERADFVCEGLGVSCTQWLLIPCASPTPTPSPTPSPSPSPTCNPATKPNPQNCQCGDAGGGTVDWFCGCTDGSEPANYLAYTSNYGCPPDKSNNGYDCCLCAAPTTCAPGCHWDTNFCQCVDLFGTPCPEPTPGLCEIQMCEAGCAWDCSANNGAGGCVGSGCASPILIDISGDGFALTDTVTGVDFDISSDGVRERLGWTVINSDDAFLVLDRNRNGVVDNGMELFGNFTPQTPPQPGQLRNGFLALGEYDKAAKGGNRDGVIDRRDAIFVSLRLWQDANHNGISEFSELHTLRGLGLRTLNLDYKESRRTDQYGNRFRYRAKVRDTRGAQLGRWAWDVFLVNGP